MNGAAAPRAIAAAAVLALVVGAVAGCADAPGAGAGGTPVPEPGPSSSAPSGGPVPASPPVEDLPVPAPSGRPVTVSGTVADGVESGCLVLTSGGTTYLLLGSHEGLTPGASVTVEGTLAPDVLTTCQQGTPLRVTAVRTR